MNQKKAKQIKRRAMELLVSLNISPGEGYGEYETINNRTTWEPALNPDGSQMKDQEGVPLIQPIKSPGTVQSKWKYKLFYKFLIKLYKKGDKDAERILNMSKEDLLDHFNRS